MGWLQLISNFFPVVLQVVQAIEQAIQAQGAAKKAVAMAVIAPPPEQADDVGRLVNVTVSALNAAGVFKPAPKP